MKLMPKRIDYKFYQGLQKHFGICALSPNVYTTPTTCNHFHHDPFFCLIDDGTVVQRPCELLLLGKQKREGSLRSHFAVVVSAQCSYSRLRHILLFPTCLILPLN